MRLLFAVALALSLAACVWTSGPDCHGACDKVKNCPQVTQTFRLSCSSIGVGCFDVVGDCADCINNHTCDEIGAGACDGTPAKPLCLVPTPDAGTPAPDAGSEAPDAGTEADAGT